jgi:hypothetical protein
MILVHFGHVQVDHVTSVSISPPEQVLSRFVSYHLKTTDRINELSPISISMMFVVIKRYCSFIPDLSKLIYIYVATSSLVQPIFLNYLLVFTRRMFVEHLGSVFHTKQFGQVHTSIEVATEMIHSRNGL